MFKKLLILLLIIMLLSATAPAFADSANEYVYIYGGVTENNTDPDTYALLKNYPYLQRFVYPSPHKSDLNVHGATHTRAAFKLFNLIDLSLVAQGGTGPYASFPVYCFDYDVSAVPGHKYSLATLAESQEFFEQETRERLRAILTHSFPEIFDETAIQAAANAWLEEHGGDDKTPITGLTKAECIMSTQTAIWILTNGISVIDYYTWSNPDSFSDEECIYPEYRLEQGDPVRTEINNKQLIRYLLALEGEESIIPKQYSFTSTKAELTPLQNGKFNATITVTINEAPDDRANFSIQAFCGELQSAAQTAIANQTEYVLTIENVPSADATFEATLSGMQLVEDFFILMPEDGPSASQVMGGLMDYKSEIDAKSTISRITVLPTATPSATPTATPSATPTATPSATPTASPTATPTASPSATPTASPTATPTASPSAVPQPDVTPTATIVPDPVIPQTGDSSNILMMIMLFLAASFILLVYFRRVRA